MALIQFDNSGSARPVAHRLSRRAPNAAFLRAVVITAFGVWALSVGAFGAAAYHALAGALAFVLIASGVGWRLQHVYPHARLGWCNRVTLGRLGLASVLGIAAIASPGPSWEILVLGAIALSLDGVDGWLARREGLTSRFGARFDMEVDSALALLLALNAAWGPAAAAYAALLGLPRYMFGAAAIALPWLGRDLPDRFERKVVCVLQLSVLLALQMPGMTAGVAATLIAVAITALAWSFARDIRWLWHQRA